MATIERSFLTFAQRMVTDLRMPAAAWIMIAVLYAYAFGGCRQNTSPYPEATQFVLQVSGQTMGTTYHVTAIGIEPGEALKTELDSVLLAINSEVNTYDSLSMISQFNQGATLTFATGGTPDVLATRRGEHFGTNLTLAQEIYDITDGAFDPSVGPLVNYYGFGASFRDSAQVDEAMVAKLLLQVGLSKLDVQSGEEGVQRITRPNPGFQLDFSAIAKGYAVDQLAAYLQQRHGCRRYFVEIGGETRVQGLSARDESWRIGINKPDETSSTKDIQLIIGLTSGALATSGNYRNARMRGGERYVHTINPTTGFARQTSLLSATISAPDCATADAYATACMVLGEQAPTVLAKAGLSGCLIFAGSDQEFDIRYIGDFERHIIQ